jgi:streptogramin lyase
VLLVLGALFVGSSAAPSRSESVAACKNVGWIAELQAASPQAFLRLAGKSCRCSTNCARVARNQRLYQNETMSSGGGSITFKSVVPGSPNLTCIAPRGAKDVLYPKKRVGSHDRAVLQILAGATSCQVEAGPLQSGEKNAVFLVRDAQLRVFPSVEDPVFGIKAVGNGSLIQVKKGSVSVAAASGHGFTKVQPNQQIVVQGATATVAPLVLDAALKPGLCKLTPKLGQTDVRNASGAHPNGNPLGIAPDSDGNLWFTDNATPAIGLFDLTTRTITYPLNGPRPGSKPTFVVADPGGRLWFTDASATQPAVGLIDPKTKTITEYSKGLRADSIPWNPWYDAAHDLVWFTDQSGAIGALDPQTGTITEYSRGLNAGSHPEGLVVDAQGNVWFTDDNGAGAAIGMLDVTTHTIHEYSAGLVEGSLPRGITIDSAGTVWFADEREQDGLIGKISTTDAKHQILEYPVFANGGNRHSVPEGLTPYKGFIWFTDDGATKAIGRIDPTTGAVAESNLGTASQPIGVVVVNDVLWFTDRFANAPKIGRVEAKASC